MHHILNGYAEQFAKWQPAGMLKLLGPKPTLDQLLLYSRIGGRQGHFGLECFAGAMSLREQGVTGSEIIIACGAQQLSKMRGYVTDGLLKRVFMGKRNGSFIYKHELTPKGLKRVEGNLAREAAIEAAEQVAEPVKPVKARGVAKGTAKLTSKAAKPGKQVPAVNVMTPAAASTAVEISTAVLNGKCEAEPMTGIEERRLPDNNVVTE
jgi:hypothetical protein